MFDCFGVRFVPLFLIKKKPNFQNGQKSRENRTEIDIILSFLAKPLDKHGVTLVHITYPPLKIIPTVFCVFSMLSSMLEENELK